MEPTRCLGRPPIAPLVPPVSACFLHANCSFQCTSRARKGEHAHGRNMCSTAGRASTHGSGSPGAVRRAARRRRRAGVRWQLLAAALGVAHRVRVRIRRTGGFVAGHPRVPWGAVRAVQAKRRSPAAAVAGKHHRACSLSALRMAHGPCVSVHVYMYTHFTFGPTHAHVRPASDVGVAVVLQLAMKLVQLGVVATCTALVPMVDEPRCAHVGLDRASFRWLLATTWVATLVTLACTAVLFAFARLGRLTPDKRQRCPALPLRPIFPGC